MKQLGVREEDLIERFILGSGRGGQKLQKTSSCVYLKHIPTGIEVKCQKERSQEANRYYARMELCDRIEEMRTQEKLKRDKVAALRRQQRRRPSAGQRAKAVEEKRQRGQKKRLRKPPND